MHIPDGYLDPKTCASTYAAMAPFWAVASAKLNKTLRGRQVPMLAMSVAFSFLIMMFNIPVPGGTSGHAVGAVLVSVLLGPWAACMVLTLTIVLQALLYSDGGITCIGANCLSMAVVMPFAGYGVYRLVSWGATVTSKRRMIGAAIGGYVGLNAAAVTTAVMFGIQPLIAHDPSGRPLYAPYPLRIAVPFMATGHLLVFGILEAIVTGLVVAYLQRTDPSLIHEPKPTASKRSPGMAATKKLWIALAVLVVLTPIGIILPARFHSGSAWGEWSVGEVKQKVGYAPSGLSKLSDAWKAPVPDYAVDGQGSVPLASRSIQYAVSAALGAGALVIITLLVGKALARRKDSDSP